MSSARFVLGGLAASATLVGVTGCVTTMQKNARTLLLNQRTLASESAVRVSSENPDVRVLGVLVLHAGTQAALAVSLSNTSTRPLTDLPISVGIRARSGRRIYLNAGAGGAYWGAHVASIAPRGVTTWVYTARRLPRGVGAPFALVGRAHLPPSTTAGQLPVVGAALRSRDGRRLRVEVVNRSGIPQYALQVYAVQLDGGHVVAAARGTVPELDGGARATVSLRLVGAFAGTQVRVYALPTIFA